MDYLQLIETMSPEVYQNLKQSLELGKWPDGKPLTTEQRHNAMQAVIAWGEWHLPEEERVGYIDKGHKSGDTCDDPQEMTLNWKEQEK
jgi:uncharacterized protein YeaC (DUF1315 family)